MTIKEVHLITFSPTHTSKRVGEAIVHGLDLGEANTVNLTRSCNVRKELPADALAVITVPVYGGHVAPLALQRMQEIRASHTPAIIGVVYGNRAYEHALEELDAFAGTLGFQVIAAGTFIGEHSYSNAEFPIAAGRPDEDDLAYAELFGKKVRTKIENAADREHLYGVDVKRIQRPRQPFFPLFRFLRRVVKFRKSGGVIPRTPHTDANLCTHCGACVELCPTGAIAKENECHTDAEKCIRCCACVKGCPRQARTFDTPFSAMLSECFRRPKENRIIL